MKIYLTTSKRLPKNFIEDIEKAIISSGHKLLKRVRPDLYHKTSQKEAEKISEENIYLIKSADVLVAETSFVSAAIGFHLAQAIAQKKPLVILYNFKDFKGMDRSIQRIPLTLKGIRGKNSIMCEYNSSNLFNSIGSCLKEAEKLLHTKFNFLVPPEIGEYLEWNVKFNKRSKSDVTRESLLNTMKSDEDYLSFKTKNSNL